jgi:hypothetical protein
VGLVIDLPIQKSHFDMLTAKPLRLLAGASLVGSVAADAGDDFSNNLFSDLAPYVMQTVP